MNTLINSNIKKYILTASIEQLRKSKRSLNLEINKGLLKDTKKHSYTLELKYINAQIAKLQNIPEFVFYNNHANYIINTYTNEVFKFTLGVHNMSIDNSYLKKVGSLKNINLAKISPLYNGSLDKNNFWEI